MRTATETARTKVVAICRGFEIHQLAEAIRGNGFVWADERGVEHLAHSDEAAMDQIDAHRRALRQAVSQ